MTTAKAKATTAKAAKVCRHCTRRRANRPRGLCWGCWEAPGVRDLYPPAVPRWVGNPAHVLPAAPCPHPAGSPGRFETLQRRAAAGVALRHPADNPAFSWEG